MSEIAENEIPATQFIGDKPKRVRKPKATKAKKRKDARTKAKVEKPKRKYKKRAPKVFEKPKRKYTRRKPIEKKAKRKYTRRAKPEAAVTNSSAVMTVPELHTSVVLLARAVERLNAAVFGSGAQEVATAGAPRVKRKYTRRAK